MLRDKDSALWLEKCTEPPATDPPEANTTLAGWTVNARAGTDPQDGHRSGRRQVPSDIDDPERNGKDHDQYTSSLESSVHTDTSLADQQVRLHGAADRYLSRFDVVPEIDTRSCALSDRSSGSASRATTHDLADRCPERDQRRSLDDPPVAGPERQ